VFSPLFASPHFLAVVQAAQLEAAEWWAVVEQPAGPRELAAPRELAELPGLAARAVQPRGAAGFRLADNLLT